MWDTKQRLMRYIYNSSEVGAASVSMFWEYCFLIKFSLCSQVPVPACTKLNVMVEIQEDDMPGRTPDSEFTSIKEAALASEWLGPPVINTNGSEVEIDR